MWRPSYRRVPVVVAALLSVGLAFANGTPEAASASVGGRVLLAQSADEMAPRMRTALIEGIQAELNEKGYAAGPVDGVSGARTRAAIRSYQRDTGLRVNGQPSKELLDHLKFSSGSTERQKPAQQTTDRDAGGPAAMDADLIESVQRELQIRGYYAGPIDGIAGPNTAAGVRAFQRDAGFDATGNVDRRLLSELRVADRDIKADR